ncbi:hypothetical protein, partial [Parvimonas micra]|uniref:hypothetical protein n=1 Tax=Parvimonas micra TaxID=33033 RepID=UPI002B49D398
MTQYKRLSYFQNTIWEHICDSFKPNEHFTVQDVVDSLFTGEGLTPADVTAILDRLVKVSPDLIKEGDQYYLTDRAGVAEDAVPEHAGTRPVVGMPLPNTLEHVYVAT